jgi:hypothetical protein
MMKRDGREHVRVDQDALRGGVRSKDFIAQVNGAVFIAVIHNLDVIIDAIHENGLVVP